MKIINNKKDWEDLFRMAYSQSKFDPSIYPYPKEFPCMGKSERFTPDYYPGGGGDYVVFYVAYFPKTRSVKQAFISGLTNGWTKLFSA